MSIILRWGMPIACALTPAALFFASAPAAADWGSRIRNVEVGPIWNQMDADRKCPDAARKAGGKWTGQWRTTRPGQMSECEIAMESGAGHGGGSWGSHGGGNHGNGWGRDRERMVEVGPIWNQMDAERKCREAARANGGTWTGQWKTTRPGQMSVCEVKR